MESRLFARTAAAAAQTTANNAATAAATAQSTANAKEDAFTETIETFTALTGAANTAVSVTLAQTPKAGFNIHVFFNGVRVKTTSNTGGSRTLTFTVPYATEPTDDIVVNYSY